MLVEPFIPFLLFILALYGTPGPATLSIAASGSTFGFRKSIAYVLGLMIGIITIFLMVALGLGVLFTTYPSIHLLFKWISLLYMFYLAYQIARATPADLNNRKFGFIHGITLNLLNPKAYFAVIATVAQFTHPEGPLNELIRLVVWVFGLVLITNLLWAYLGSFIKGSITSSKLSSRLNIIFAILLIVSVLFAFLM